MGIFFHNSGKKETAIIQHLHFFKIYERMFGFLKNKMKNMLKKWNFDALAATAFFGLLAVMFALGGSPAHAAASDSLSPASFSAALITEEDAPDDVIQKTSFRESVLGVINYFLTFVGLIAVIFIIYAGILMVTAQGEDDAITKGKNIILWASAGIIVILLSYSIVNFIIFAGKYGGT